MTAATPTDVTYATADGGTAHAHLFDGGDHAIVLAHGKVFDKESWSNEAAALSADGLSVLAPDFRGYGQSTGPETNDGFAQDIAAAVSYLRDAGKTKISVLGASMGAAAAAKSVADGLSQDVANLILMAPRVLPDPNKLVADKVLFIVSEEEDIFDSVQAGHAATPGNKDFKVYPGSAHAQHLFKGDHADDVLSSIRATLSD